MLLSVLFTMLTKYKQIDEVQQSDGFCADLAPTKHQRRDAEDPTVEEELVLGQGRESGGVTSTCEEMRN